MGLTGPTGRPAGRDTSAGSVAAPTAVIRFPVGPDKARWRTFADPVVVATTRRRAHVSALVRQAEQWARDGLWVVGALAYEASPAFDPAHTTHDPGAQPLAWFAAFDDVVEASQVRPPGFAVGPWAGADAAAHRAAFVEIVERIAAGDTYQVNYTQRLRAPFAGDPLGLFAALAQAQPTAYSAYLDLGRFAVCSASPELFVRRVGDLLRAQPMKGTAPRAADPDADVAAARALRTSAKESAENVMIVDLLRNDLSRVCLPGSVRVRDLCAVETHPTLHTMTSTVEGVARPDADLAAVFGAVFPCGSVTGAPKISSMRIIRDLEPDPRGIYCGAIGVLAPGGDATFSVPIRTAVVDREAGFAEYGVGGGITFASEPDAEFAELLTKARVLSSLPGAGGGS